MSYKTIIITCTYCGENIEKNSKDVKKALIRNPDHNFFCNLICSSKHKMGKTWKKEGQNQSYRKIAFNNYEPICSRCGYGEDRGNCLEVHHIDEDRNNNSLDNLIILCPNCHTEFHKGYWEIVL